ncbi:MAG: hypothetical protein ACFFDN_32900 [Candidatus Hodarchaeota archaeon]
MKNNYKGIQKIFLIWSILIIIGIIISILLNLNLKDFLILMGIEISASLPLLIIIVKISSIDNKKDLLTTFFIFISLYFFIIYMLMLFINPSRAGGIGIIIPLPPGDQYPLVNSMYWYMVSLIIIAVISFFIVLKNQ